MDLFGNNSDSEVEPFGAGLVEPAPILKPRIIETTFDGLLSSPIKLHEDLAKGCGGQIWPAGETLAKYLLRRYGDGSNELRGKRIAELGAGGGLVGLVLSRDICSFASGRANKSLGLRLRQGVMSLRASFTLPIWRL